MIPSVNLATADAVYGAPPLALFGFEPLRALFEYAGMHLMDQSRLPPGDGHPVIVFPGLAADQATTAPLQQCCARLGYDIHDWGQGRNYGHQGDVDDWLGALARHVSTLVDAAGRKVSLIGWSLGGIYAREVARLLPSRVRQVISIGTPFAGTGDETNVGWLFRLLNGRAPTLDAALAQRLRATPPVPTTSIYSRSDGIVAWQACRENESNSQAENIEVEGSHIGLVWNPKVLKVVADRLRQADGGWQRYQA